MKKTTRIKPAKLATQLEFEATIADIVRLDIESRAIANRREKELERINTIYDAEQAPVSAQIKALLAQALNYAEEHRAELLPKDAKRVRLSLATYGWRTGNRTLALLARVSEENAINALKAGGLADEYVATKEVLARAKILADCKDDKTLPYLRPVEGVMQPVKLADFGLKVVQSEAFFVEPVSATDAAETIRVEVVP